VGDRSVEQGAVQLRERVGVVGGDAGVVELHTGRWTGGV
jgi:hypothetical protein